MAPLVPPVAPARPAPTAIRPPPPPPPASPGASTKVAGVEGLLPEQLLDLHHRHEALEQLDYFQLLHLEPGAAPGDIKKAFYRESRTYHPDRFFHVSDAELKGRVGELYKRVTEAYYVLRDDTKRKKYQADITGPDRASKLRFTEASETETKAAAKREIEEQIGTHPKGRQFYQTAAQDAAAERWQSAERNLKMALTFEPANPRYKEKLAEVQQRLNDASKAGGNNFKIK